MQSITRKVQRSSGGEQSILTKDQRLGCLAASTAFGVCYLESQRLGAFVQNSGRKLSKDLDIKYFSITRSQDLLNFGFAEFLNNRSRLEVVVIGRDRKRSHVLKLTTRSGKTHFSFDIEVTSGIALKA